MAEPVIPDFGEASDCVAENRLFCPDWVRENWDPVLQPALVQHIYGAIQEYGGFEEPRWLDGPARKPRTGRQPTDR